MRKKGVAQQNGEGIPPTRIGRGLTAPLVRVVEDIVVDKSGSVNEFDNYREVDVPIQNAAGGASRQKGKSGAQPLAMAFDRVRNVGLDGRIEGSRLVPDPLFDRLDLGTDRLKRMFEAQCFVELWICFSDGIHCPQDRAGTIEVNGSRPKEAQLLPYTLSGRGDRTRWNSMPYEERIATSALAKHRFACECAALK